MSGARRQASRKQRCGGLEGADKGTEDGLAAIGDKRLLETRRVARPSCRPGAWRLGAAVEWRDGKHPHLAAMACHLASFCRVLSQCAFAEERQTSLTHLEASVSNRSGSTWRQQQQVFDDTGRLNGCNAACTGLPRQLVPFTVAAVWSTLPVRRPTSSRLSRWLRFYKLPL